MSTSFTEFYNKNKNVLESSTSRRITSSLPISEERNKFFNGELFKKYDMVESEGVQYRILEQCSNYYNCVDASGNLTKKFAKQLTPVQPSELSITESVFHGYQLQTESAKQLLKDHLSIIDENFDDVGLLKTLKEADKKMETSYQNKDRLTIAKMIADACGVPHDVVSTPENLVAQSIRKAKKDPAMMRNKEVISNMLEIAKSVGIKFGDTTFEPKVNESLDEAKKPPEYEVRVTTTTGMFHIHHAVTGKRVAKDVANNRMKAYEILDSKWNKPKVNESELDEGIVDKLEKHGKKVEQLKKDYANKLRWSNEPHIYGNLGSYKHGQGATKIKNHLKSQFGVDVNESLDEVKRTREELAARAHHDYAMAVKTGDTYKAKVLKQHIEFHNQVMAKKADLGESEQLDELSIEAMRDYTVRARDSGEKLTKQGISAKKLSTSYKKFSKAGDRFANAAKADKKIFKKEWEKTVGIKNESITLSNLRAKLAEAKEVTPEVQPEKETLPHGHTFGATSETNRKQLIKKLKND